MTKKLLIIIIIVVVAGGAILGFFWWQKGGERKIVEQAEEQVKEQGREESEEQIEPKQERCIKEPEPWSSVSEGSYSQYTALLHSNSPALLHTYNKKGDHVGLTETGRIEADIPGTYFYVPSLFTEADDLPVPCRSGYNEIVWIYTSEDLIFKITGVPEDIYLSDISEGQPLKIEGGKGGVFEFQFSRALREKGEEEVTVTYWDIQFTKDTVATLKVGPENPEYLIEIDLDGDGKVDKVQALANIKTYPPL